MRFFSEMSIVITSILILGICSCNGVDNVFNKKDPRLDTRVIYSGYEYVVIEVQHNDFDNVYSKGNFATSTTSNGSFINQNTDYEANYNNSFYPTVVNMVPGAVVYGKASLQGVEGEAVKMVAKGASKSCQIQERTMTGDKNGWQAGAFGSVTNLYESFGKISGGLVGDFEFVGFDLYQGAWSNGVYTTYNEKETFYHPLMEKNVKITLRKDSDYFYAKMGQPIFYIENHRGYNIEFCDVVFFNTLGDEITLSGNLKGY